MTELNKAEQELVDKIAREGVELYAFPNLWKRLTEAERNNWRQWAQEKILALVKEASYKSPEEVAELHKAGMMKVATFINEHLIDAHASSGNLKLDIDLVAWVKQKEKLGL